MDRPPELPSEGWAFLEAQSSLALKSVLATMTLLAQRQSVSVCAKHGGPAVKSGRELDSGWQSFANRSPQFLSLARRHLNSPAHRVTAG